MCIYLFVYRFVYFHHICKYIAQSIATPLTIYLSMACICRYLFLTISLYPCICLSLFLCAFLCLFFSIRLSVTMTLLSSSAYQFLALFTISTRMHCDFLSRNLHVEWIVWLPSSPPRLHPSCFSLYLSFFLSLFLSLGRFLCSLFILLPLTASPLAPPAPFISMCLYRSVSLSFCLFLRMCLSLSACLSF